MLLIIPTEVDLGVIGEGTSESVWIKRAIISDKRSCPTRTRSHVCLFLFFLFSMKRLQRNRMVVLVDLDKVYIIILILYNNTTREIIEVLTVVLVQVELL